MMTKRRYRSTWICPLAALLLCTLPALVHAAGGKRVGVPKFDGAQEALVRKQVMKVLKAHGYELVKSREMEAGMSNTGALLESDDGFQKISKELSLMAIVTGEVGKKRAKIIVHDGREGSVLGDATFTGANPKKIAAEVSRGFWSKLGADIGRGHVPSGAKKPTKAVAEAPEDDENAPEAGEAAESPEPSSKSKEKETVAAAEGEAAGGGEGESDQPKKKKRKSAKAEADSGEEEDSGVPSALPTLELVGGMTGIMRAYAYAQDRSMLRPYNGVGPAANLHAVFYPMSFLTNGPLQHLGLVLSVEQAFGITAGVPADEGPPLGGKSFNTSVHQYVVGLRYRIPFDMNQIWIEATGGEHAYVFKSPSGCTANVDCRPQLDIPDTIYQYVRAGAGARFEFGDFSLGVNAGYRLILNGAGTHIKHYFPHASVGGIDADAYVGYRVTPGIELRLGAQIRRYFYAMNSEFGVDNVQPAVMNGVRIAGGAIDQYISFGGGVAFLLGGADRPEAAAAAAEDDSGKKKKKKKRGDEEGGGDAESTPSEKE